MSDTDFGILSGLTLQSIEFERVAYVKGDKRVENREIGAEMVRFKTTCGRVFEMQHHQNCCEDVQVEDVCGDPTDLIGSPILLAECVSSAEPPPGAKGVDDENLWTFYKLATMNGAVTIRWYGSSNGYYGVEVSFGEVTK
jgi:hypothetical protein